MTDQWWVTKGDMFYQRWMRMGEVTLAGFEVDCSHGLEATAIMSEILAS